MKTIGISCRRRVNSCCRSGPLRPGMATSRIRHFVSLTYLDTRNSSADENAWAAKPNSFSKSGSDSRTDSSSSTTDMSGRVSIRLASQRVSDLSAQLQRVLRLPLLHMESKMRTSLLVPHSKWPTDGLDDFR